MTPKRNSHDISSLIFFFDVRFTRVCCFRLQPLAALSAPPPSFAICAAHDAQEFSIYFLHEKRAVCRLAFIDISSAPHIFTLRQLYCLLPMFQTNAMHHTRFYAVPPHARSATQQRCAAEARAFVMREMLPAVMFIGAFQQPDASRHSSVTDEFRRRRYRRQASFPLLLPRFAPIRRRHHHADFDVTISSLEMIDYRNEVFSHFPSSLTFRE